MLNYKHQIKMQTTNTRILTIFPRIPTEQPRSVDELNELQRELWIEFCDQTKSLLRKRQTNNSIQTITISVMIVMFLILIILIIVLIFKKFKKQK